MRDQGNILVVIAVSNLILAGFILLRNARRRPNILFSGLNLAAALWAGGLAGFIFAGPPNAALSWAKLYYIAAALIAFFFLLFSIDFTGNWKHLNQHRLIWLSLPPLAIFVLVLGSQRWLLTGLSYHSWGKEIILNKTGYAVYSIYFIAYTLAGFSHIYKKLRTARGLLRIYLKYLFAGLVVAFALGMTFNLIYPAFGHYQYIWVGPLFILVYTFLTSYAIVRHKLFDIRSFVVRSVAYLLTFGVIALLYIVPALLLTNYLLNSHLRGGTLIVLAVITLLAALIFQTVKNYFNRASAKLFYRDYYEPQDVLDSLSNLLVGSVDLREIKRRSAAILKTTLKPASVKYLLVADSDPQDKPLLDILNKRPGKILNFDELDIGKEAALHEAMGQNDIALAVRLQTRNEELGFLVLGFKQSGSPYSEDDLKLMGIVSDEIAVGLQNALRFEEIQRFNVTLQDKVNQATRQLRQANVRLKELDATKDEFISMASHQLRTPLTTIKGYLSMVLEGDVGPVSKNEKQMIQQAFDSAERMVFLIGDLLNVSRLQSGKFVIDNQPTDLAKIVQTEVQQLKESADHHHLSLTFKKPEHFPLLNLDETKIRQVIMNFMDNAIYYTPAGGSIEVALAATDNSVSYTVTDTGLGVPAADQHHLFSKFYRAGNARKMRPDGTGLGLFMAKKVITAQGGAIIFKSQEGKGSTFGFSFPRAKLEIKGRPSVKPQELEAAVR